MLYLLLICTLLGLLAAVATGIVITREPPAGDAPDFLLVLGSTVNGTEPSIMLSERIRTAFNYLTCNPHVVCIPTGGKNPSADIPEAQCIANELIAMGIDPQHIWIEPKATSTLDNLRFSLDLIEEKTGSRPCHVGFVTSDFHVFRVQLTADRMGLSTTAMGSKSAHTIFYYPAFLREIIAVWYYFLFKKSPTP